MAAGPLNDQAMTANVQMQWGLKIPLRDGISLNATLYRPVHQSAAAPALFTLTPYVGQTYHDRGTFFASHGYPFLTVDARGRGNSEGTFKSGCNEGTDAYDIVEWLARQNYCNGQVAMWGGSYGGYVQWGAAAQRPPHLATIAPVAAPFRGVDSPLRNNIFCPYRIQWLTLLAGRTSQDKIFADQGFWSAQFRRWLESGTAFRDIDVFLGNPSPIFQDWLAHPQLDAYWDQYNPRSSDYARMTLPILTITGIYDGNQLGALAHYREHMRNAPDEGRDRHYLVIGPWDHAGTRTPKGEFCGLKVGAASLIDMNDLHLQWYAWTLQNGPKPPFLQKRIAYYVMGAERWRYADSLEDITSQTQPYYLHSTANPSDVFHSGLLDAQVPTGGPDSYVYDPRDTSGAQLQSTIDPESRIDQRIVHARAGRHLIYHSAPLESDIEISGWFKLTVWLSIDQPDTDFGILISEVALDGSAIELTTDCLRARYRESLREQHLIRTLDPLRYDFTRFSFVSRRIPRGHRLRLVIGPLDSIYFEKNYNSGGTVADECMADARTVTVKLFHDERHPSALYIPIGDLEYV